MENQDLQAYLDAFRSEGEFDSEGFFTLDRQKAVGKIARYMLPDEGLWILKTVQAACHLNTLELRVREVKAFSSLSYRLSESVDLTELRKGLVEGTQVHGLHLLCQALRSVALTQKRLVTLTLTAGNRVTTFLLNNGQVNESESESEQFATQTQLHILVQRPVERTDTLFERGKEALQFADRYLDSFRSEEYDYLMNRARVSPIPLFLNGARIDDMNIPWYLKDGERAFYVGALYAQSRNDQENYLSIPQAISRRKTPTLLPGNHGPLASMSFGPAARANCLLGVHYYSKRAYNGTVYSRLHMVKDGVVVDTAISDFQATMGFDLVVSPPQIKTDITGLKANIPESLTERYRRYLIQFRNPLKKLALYLAGPSFQVRSFQAPSEFEGLDFSSKLRMFAAGRLKVRRDAGQSLEWTLSRAPFNTLEVGQST